MSDSDQPANVSIKFAIGPFEVCIGGTTNQSRVMEFIAAMLGEFKQKQSQLVEAVSGVDLSKIRPVTVSWKGPSDDPMEIVAGRVNVPVEKLSTVLRVENGMPIIISAQKFDSIDKASLVLIYTFQFGLGRNPKNAEVNEALKSSGFNESFGRHAKGNLTRARKIDEKDDKITLIGTGIADAEEEIKRAVGSS